MYATSDSEKAKLEGIIVEGLKGYFEIEHNAKKKEVTEILKDGYRKVRERARRILKGLK